MFTISEMNTEKPKTMWVPVEGTDTLYVGQIVSWTPTAGAPKVISDGVGPLGTAVGAADTTSKGLVAGIVVGTNYRKPVYSSAWKNNSITGVASVAGQAAVEKVGGAGEGAPVGDQQAKVEIALINSTTVIEGPFYNAAYGTPPTEVTVTVASADGGITAPTTGACDFTPVADLATMYGRSGANAGASRITTDTSTTQPTVTHAFPAAAIAVGDTFVRVPARLGPCRINFDAESMYIAAEDTPDANYYQVFGVKLFLGEAGKEKLAFMFAPPHFDQLRA